MAGTTKRWVWVVVAVAASCALCSVATLGVTLLGLAADEAAPGELQAPAAVASRPGVEGGFSLTLPDGWRDDGPGRFRAELRQGEEVLTVELVRLPAVPGLEAAERRLTELWGTRIAADWRGVAGAPWALRRFVANGARAVFTAAELRPRESEALMRVSLYLVEAGDRLEPLVFIQSHQDPTGLAATRDISASMSWGRSHALVEQALAGTRGSPVGRPLVSDEEVVGRFALGSTETAQWVHTVTGGTSMTAVARAVRYEFSEDHRFTYEFQGGAGQVGAMQFAKDVDQGRWAVVQDHLELAFDSGKAYRFLIAGAGRRPEGPRWLLLLQEPQASLDPGAAMKGELYVETGR